ncbi:MAG: UDP-N-acetylmuramate dehydrogenase [Christensenellales bacterium]
MQAGIKQKRDIFLTLLDKITAYKLDEPMKKHTSFLCGGKAAVYAACEKPYIAASALYLAKLFNMPYAVLGRGSNVLFSDKGFNGLVLHLKGDSVSAKGDALYAFAGTKLSFISNRAKDLSLTGLEFAHGIPGSVGGAVYMNAGCFGSSISDALEFAECIDIKALKCAENINEAKKLAEAFINKETPLPIHKYLNKELNFSYRNSLVKEQNLLVLNAAFTLKKGNKEAIENTMREMLNKRRSSQPLEYPNAGSFFKRPKDNFAGALIEQAGLKGLSIGGAKVSEKHAGFIINTGGAAAEDIFRLSKEVQDRVYAKFNVLLEPEVEFIGFE